MTFIDLSATQPVVRAADTVIGQLGGLGARFIMDGAPSRDRFAVVEHPIGPRGLAAPLHRHTREDEYSFVLEGTWGFQLGERVVHAHPGDFVYKPRDVWHAFWNATDQPARLLELISPAGFERFFVEMSQLSLPPSGNVAAGDAVAALLAKYGLHMDFDSAERLARDHGLDVPGLEGPS